jgi:hypothetical protein
MATNVLVQASFLDVEPPIADRSEPRRDTAHAPARPDSWVRRPSSVPRRPLNYVRVTRDPAVALSWDQSSRLAAETTWQLARSISAEQLDQLRALAYAGPTAPSSPR